MALAEDAAVALKPLGIIGPIIEDVVVERAMISISESDKLTVE